MTDLPEEVEAEITLVMNEDGEWEVDSDPDEAVTRLLDNSPSRAIRTVTLIVRMRPPVIVELAVDVPDESGTTTVATVKA